MDWIKRKDETVKKLLCMLLGYEWEKTTHSYDCLFAWQRCSRCGSWRKVKIPVHHTLELPCITVKESKK